MPPKTKPPPPRTGPRGERGVDQASSRRSPDKSPLRSPGKRSPGRAAGGAGAAARGARGRLGAEAEEDGALFTELTGVTETRSPGGTRIYSMTVDGSVPNTRGGEELTEEEKLQQWKDSLAAGGADDDDAFGFGAGDPDDPAARAIRDKYGLPQPEPSSPDGSPPKPRDDGTGPPVGEKYAGGDFDFNSAGFAQMAAVTEENAALLDRMDAKDREIDRLTDLLAAVEPVPGMEPEKFMDVMQGTEMVDQDPRDVKIIAMAKKQRTTNLALQKEKDRVRALTKEVETLQKIADSKVYPKKLRGKEAEEAKAKEREEADAEARLAEAEGRARQLSKQVMESRMRADAAARDLKATQNALQREVGSKVDLAKVLAEGSNWRGRAQKIVMMKAKIRELTERLEDAGLSAGPGGRTSVDGGASLSRASATSSMATGVDAQARQDLRAMEQERQAAMERMSADYERVSAENADNRRKAEAAKARVRILENEGKKMKKSLQTLISKATGDDEFVDALRQEVTAQRRTIAELEGELRRTRGDLERSMSSFGGGLEGADGSISDPVTMKHQLEDARRRLEGSEKIIASLRGDLRIARQKAAEAAKAAAAASAGSGGGRGDDHHHHDSGRPPRPGMLMGSARPSSAERVRAEAKREAEFADANLKMLQMDNIKLQETRDVLKAKLAASEQREEGMIGEITELRQRLAKANRELGVQNSGVHARTSRKPTEEAMASIRAQNEALQEENAALRKTFRNTLAARDEELAVLREQLETQQRLYSEHIDAFREKLGKAKADADAAESGAGGGMSKEDAAELESLRRDNEILRTELTDVRARYQALNARTMETVRHG